ncbi:Gfo/Idh/MocA family protein [Rhodoplanes sp. Z2-YC6860]|uniref:Gfo/Idh/MocA family protein n=1 Tax=Rhodoplanes sp. Z2-YC6860 TaxID=674703 RepID=UPI00078E252F|nr:Gfo/Idh/MocA family oxidoreductase [Rhodoplanes sp. Z2-YC6860]AMN39540.1 oxidoreductase domain-containing protein [Rhodoplanes sp. Z2-YC6860]
MTRVAIVGAGYGGYVLAPAFRRCRDVEIAGLCAPSAARRDKVAAAFGIKDVAPSLEALLARTHVDAVAIAVPPDQQATVAQFALERRLPVFAEKPLATSVAEAERLTSLAAQAGVPAVVDFIFPELAAWRVAKALLEQGAIGPLRHVVVTWLFESYDHARNTGSWKTVSGRGGGVLQYFGSHTLHYLEWFCGTIEALSGQLSLAPGQSGGDTLAGLQMRFAGGATGAVVLCDVAFNGGGHHLKFLGDEGTLTLANSTANPVKFTLQVQRRGESSPSTPSVPADLPALQPGEDPRIAPAARIAERFVAAIQAGSEARPSFADALRVQRLMEPLLLARRSAS